MGYLGESIPKLGFGLMRLPKLESLFIAAGGTYFDTARVYGSSEEDIKQALVNRYPRESYQLATKNAAWVKAQSAEEARKDLEISLETTGAGYFDFYLIHNTGGARTAAFDKFEMWDWLPEIKAAGLVRHIGFSHHDNAELLDEILTKHPQMEFVQLQVNYADWENANVQSRKCVEVCQTHGKPIVIMEPVRGGTLANPPEAVAAILADADPNMSPANWALRFALDVPDIITVLSGMSTVEQMEDNIRTWKAHTPLTYEQRQVLVAAKEKLDELLDNPCTLCRYCMKECPMELNIADMMQALNRASMWGIANGKNWYGFSSSEGKRASDCIQCGTCEGACPQSIPIIEKLEKAAELFDK